MLVATRLSTSERGAFDLTVREMEIKDPGTEGFRFEKSARA
jgi:hypothetical protein